MPRIQAVDLLRGAIVVLMAIDHVRVYSGIPAGGQTAGIFFTRWITHFCAPGFVFLAGTSAFLYGRKVQDKKRLAGFLFSRGLLLVFLELTVIRLFWTFNLNFSNFMLAGVIWMLGWCMVILSAFVRWRPSTLGMIGLVIIFGQQIFQYFPFRGSNGPFTVCDTSSVGEQILPLYEKLIQFSFKSVHACFISFQVKPFVLDFEKIDEVES